VAKVSAYCLKYLTQRHKNHKKEVTETNFNNFIGLVPEDRSSAPLEIDQMKYSVVNCSLTKFIPTFTFVELYSTPPYVFITCTANIFCVTVA